MVTYLLKKSYQHKTLKEVNFKDLWGEKGVFTTMRILGKPAKIIFFNSHIKNLVKSLKIYQLDRANIQALGKNGRQYKITQTHNDAVKRVRALPLCLDKQMTSDTSS